MGKMIVSTCSICDLVFRSRTRSKNISKIGKHWRKEHPDALSRRIKEGKRSSEDNPSIQDFIVALQDAPLRAITIYEELRSKDWSKLKQVMDAMEPIMPVEMRIGWNFIEAMHDRKKGIV